jgi:hypothetical protein
MERKGNKGMERHTTESAFAPASAACASAVFSICFPRPGISDFAFAEALERSAGGG